MQVRFLCGGSIGSLNVIPIVTVFIDMGMTLPV